MKRELAKRAERVEAASAFRPVGDDERLPTDRVDAGAEARHLGIPEITAARAFLTASSMVRLLSRIFMTDSPTISDDVRFSAPIAPASARPARTKAGQTSFEQPRSN